ncbi:MAG: amino acid permease, partial [Acidobacteriaceae bacterium]|nr:amino acid permease [Acidobacteriaceae bacterium]
MGQQQESEGEFRKALGLFDSVMIVAGVMVGSGIFIVSAEITRQVGSAGWLMVAWLITGVLTIAGALSYGELAAMMPSAGGMYVYLREAFSPIFGFLYGWTLVTVIQTGTIAAVAIAFARFSGGIFPAVSEKQYLISPIHLGSSYALSLSTAQALALVIILLIALINSYGVEWGKLIQNVFTVAKLTGIVALLGLAAYAFLRNPQIFHANFARAWTPVHVTAIGSTEIATAWGMLVALCVSQTGSLFSADSWHDITFVAGEVRNPKRNLPLSLAIGTSLVIGLYLLCNLCYLAVLPVEGIQTAPQDRVATLVVDRVLPGIGKLAMSLLIMVST